jgi:hypothetical protein
LYIYSFRIIKETKGNSSDQGKKKEKEISKNVQLRLTPINILRDRLTDGYTHLLTLNNLRLPIMAASVLTLWQLL